MLQPNYQSLYSQKLTPSFASPSHLEFAHVKILISIALKFKPKFAINQIHIAKNTYMKRKKLFREKQYLISLQTESQYRKRREKRRD